jgi:hypothetical protein
MPKREEVTRILCDQKHGYSLTVEGIPALLRSEVVTQEELVAGDQVKIFSIPDGKTLITKTEQEGANVFTVGRITPAHIYFADDMNVYNVE